MNEGNDLNMHPQGLCKMCGKCCRIVVNPHYSYHEILDMADDGNEYAKDFLQIFEPYSSVDDARKVDNKTVEHLINVLKSEDKYDENTLTVYRCRYLLGNNLCSIYEERPKLCIHFPNSGWEVTPPNCGYESWLFLKREEDMKKVRKAKEDLLDLKIMRKKSYDEKVLLKIGSVETKIKHTIELFEEYGAEFW